MGVAMAVRRLRGVALLAVVVALTFSMPAAFAQVSIGPGDGGGGSSAGGIQPWIEYGKRLKTAEQLAPLTTGFAGEQVSLYDGSTSFSVADIDVPGNSSLPVRLVRHLAVAIQPQDNIQPYDTLLHGAGNWNVDVPYMAATYPTGASWGWGVDPCAGGYVPPTVIGPSDAFLRGDVWQGITIHVPGVGDTTALGIEFGVPVPTGGARLTTARRDMLTCIPMKSGLSGEGFRMTTAAGVTYDFDVGVTRTASKLRQSVWVDSGGSATGTVLVFLPRTQYYLLASKVMDRFGNTVTYSYDAAGHPTRIVANDGREIDLTYNSGEELSTATAGGRTWTYTYDAAGNLVKVTRPDASNWQYAYTGTLQPPAPPPYENLSLPWCEGMPAFVSAGYTLSATGPSGAKATFTFLNGRYYRSGVHVTECERYGNPASPSYRLLVPNYFDVMSLTSKVISGPGLQDENWTYSYNTYGTDGTFGSVVTLWGSPTESPVYPCTTCTTYKTVTVSNPDGTKTLYRYGIEYRFNNGRLLQKQTVDPSGAVVRTTQSAYLSDAAAAGEPFHGEYGYVLGGVADPTSVYIRPVVSTVITQDGATFTTTTNSFDTFARATSDTASSSLGYSKTGTTTYADDTSRWVLGMVTQSATNGIVVSQTSYDSLDRPVNEYKFGKLESTKAWNADGTLASITDGDGHTTTLSSWYRGLPQTVTYADGTHESATVNDAGWITSLTDEDGFTTNYAYDPMGRLSQISYPTGDDVAWNPTYLSFAQVAGSEYGIPGGHWRQTVHTGNGYAVTYFDALWRPLVSERYDAANKAATLSQTVQRYDVAGRKAFESYPTRSATSYTQSLPGVSMSYDALNRVTQVQQDSELGTLTATTQYLSGFQTKTTDPRGYATLTSYQAYGEPTTRWPASIAAPEGETTTLARDMFGKPMAIARNGTTYETFTYDGYQQLCKRINNGVVTFYNWDGAGNLAWSASGVNAYGMGGCSNVTSANAAGHEIDRGYDARNRLVALAFPDGDGNQTWSYTADGRPAQVITDNTGGPQVTNSYLYDRRGLLIGEGLKVGSTFNWTAGYGHDANGHLATRVAPSGQTYLVPPDALGEPTSLTAQGGSAIASGIAYAPDGHIAGYTLANGLVHAVTENERGLTGEIHDSAPGNDAEDLAYTYDADGNPTHIVDAATATRTATLTYDGLDRLASAAVAGIDGNVPAYYTYNALDQITQTSQGGRTRSYAYGSYYTDELASITDSTTGTVAYAYDSQGNLSQRGGVSYAFSVDNRLRAVNGYETGYAYDAFGRRVAKTSLGGTVYSFYDKAGQLVYQRDRDGGTHDYLYLGGKLVAIRDYNAQGAAAAMRYQHTDALGSVIAQTGSNGASITGSAAIYDAWGGIHGASAEDEPGYTGHVEDAATGLVYMQQRYYDPNVGRFLSMDPVEASGTNGSNLDRYWYANDNPYRYTDPDGLCSDGGGCGQMVRSVGAAESDSGSTTLSPVAKIGLGAMLATTGVTEEVAGPALLTAAVRYVAGKIAGALTRNAAGKADFIVSRNGTAIHNSPDAVRTSLENAGFKGKAITNDSGTETGTIHNVPHMKMDVRVMDGGPSHPPRVVTNQQGTRSLVDSATGKPFKNATPKPERMERSHIKFKDPP